MHLDDSDNANEYDIEEETTEQKMTDFETKKDIEEGTEGDTERIMEEDIGDENTEEEDSTKYDLDEEDEEEIDLYG